MTEKKKKEKKTETDSSELEQVTSKKDLNTFLLNVRDRMTDGAAAPVYALSAMNSIMCLENIYGLLDKDNKELARDIWLRIKQAGFQIKNPPLLFSEDEVTL